ncbi:hypothetical protein [Aeromicrobium sp. 179-A 4D2 NHS]|uniref:hypothetical protein n=1 Tax=Aeromicrobium sp. 179-A 4D2 NHS TaxID=3142375 RepID=UPI00399FC17E
MTDTEEFVPKRRPIDGEINLNGEVFVPLAEYERVLDESGDRRRTLAMAHMHLSFGENSEALRRIEADTGDTFENARAVRSILLSVRGGNL